MVLGRRVTCCAAHAAPQGLVVEPALKPALPARPMSHGWPQMLLSQIGIKHVLHTQQQK
jgi:hypothetical protein